MKKSYIIFMLLAACTKTNQSVIDVPIKANRYQAVHIMSKVPGAFCLGVNLTYDTIYLVPKKDYFPPWTIQDSIVNGKYYYTYIIKQLP